MEKSRNVSKPNNKYEKLPLVSVILYCAAAVSLVIYVIMRRSVAFSSFFNTYIASFFRALLSYLTLWFPGSFAENLLLLLPLILVSVCVYGARHYTKSWKSVLNFVGIVISFISLIFTLFVFTFAAGYNDSTIDQKLGLKREKLSADELCDTLKKLNDSVNAELDSIYFTGSGESDMFLTYDEMSDKLNEAYADFSEEYPFMQKFYSKVKPVLLSVPLSYTHTTGIYTFFTGESNINVDFPDYTVPFTAAHELAHQRGISREDEANLVAFLICIRSDEPYIRYSGYVNMYIYVSNALYSADKDLYKEVRSLLDARVRKEFYAYNQFFKKYEKSKVAEISNAINESGLKFQGSRSYGMVVDLTVAYYKAKEQ